MSCCKSYTLTYFNITGRAETIRLIFAAGGIKYEDKRIEQSEWPAMKPNTPWGTLPTLTVGGKTVVGQSMAIARYVAREAGLAGKCSMEQLQVDSVADAITELCDKTIPIFMIQDADKKSAAQNELLTQCLPAVLTKIANFHDSNNGGKSFLVTDKMTWADIHWYATMELMSFAVPGAAELINKQYPRLQQLFERVAANPKIAEYIKKRPQP